MLRTERRRMELEARMAAAERALAESDLATARTLGRNLRDEGFSGGYEVLAAVEQAEGRLDRAIELLEEGVTRAPAVWPLWQLLGNLYSDAHRPGDALDAYEKALGCRGVDTASVLFNMAVVYERERQPARALEQLDAMPKGHSVPGATALRVSLLRALGRNQDAIDVASAALASCPIRSGPEADEAYRQHVELHALLAAALYDDERDEALALQHAQACVEHGGTHPEALWVLRQLTGTRSPRAKLWTLTVRGRWPKAPNQPGIHGREFLRAFRVLADSEQDALEMVRRLEPPEVRGTVKLETLESIAPNRDPEAPTGVYHASVHVFAE